MMVKAALFDLDGTLLDTLRDLHDSVNEMLEHFGYQQIKIESTRKFVGNGMRKLVERSIGKEISKEMFDECMAYFVKRYDLNMKKHTCPYEKTVDVLRSLKEKGLITAVVSNKNADAVAKLCDEQFNGLVDIKLGVDENHPPKPNPEMVNKAIAALGLKADECIFIGDGETDIQTAKNANMKSICVLWGFRDKEDLEQYSPDYFVSSPEEILCIFEKLIDISDKK